MIFNSTTFFPFFLVLLCTYFVVPTWSLKKATLLFGSYIFYAFFNPWYVLIMAFSTLFTWSIANQIKRQQRMLWLLIGVSGPLLLLAYFKYATFIQTNLAVLMVRPRDPYAWSILDVALPIGISFYLFQSLSYVIDVYRGRETASLGDYALYVSFFPQLVAGPIVRAGDFLPQLKDASLGRVHVGKLNWGVTLFIFGLFQKMVLADGIFAEVSEIVFGNPASVSTIDAWTGAMAFTGQIYFDFAGYSTCAIGVALCFGFRLPVNFNFPYAAIGFSDFWKRWHISLSTWLRDYLYVPLGGNRGSWVATYRNLMLTMVLGGLWHGAAWTFVAWGALHGLYLVAERLLRNLNIPSSLIVAAMGWILTFVLTVVAWVFFRSETFTQGFSILKAMLLFDGASEGLSLSLPAALSVWVCLLVTIVFSLSMRGKDFSTFWDQRRLLTKASAVAFAVVCLIIWRSSKNEFIYFQF